LLFAVFSRDFIFSIRQFAGCQRANYITACNAGFAVFPDFSVFGYSFKKACGANLVIENRG